MMRDNNKKRDILISIVLSVISVVLLRNAYSFALNKRLILVMALVCSMWFILGLCCVSYTQIITRCYATIKKSINHIYEKKNQYFRHCLEIVVIIILAKIIEILLSVFLDIKQSYILFGSAISILLVGYVVYIYRRELYEKMHLVFFLCAMICGLFYIVCAPTEVVMSWDEHIHFDNAMKIVDTIGGYSVGADRELSMHVYSTDINYYSSSLREYEDYYYNLSYSEKRLAPYTPVKIQPVTVAYIPYAVGILLGRGLMLPYQVVFRLAKLLNYLLYSFLVSSAVKNSKHNKSIFVALGILPTVMFMAASFSYDPWVLAFCLLGYSIYQKTIENGKMTKKDAIQTGVCMFLGILVKAVYFPVMIPMLWAPDDVFEDKKHRNMFRAYIVALMILLLMSFALPMLIDSGVQTDLRGGSDVNSAEQVKFILNNPLQYAYIYFRYLFTFYLTPNHLYGFITAFAYMGNGTTSVLSAVILFATILFSGENHYASVKTGVITWISCFFSLTLVVTALYVSFTPVGLDTVNGCQFRYLIPLLYPLMSSFKGGIKNLHKYSGVYGTFVIVYMSMIMLTYMGSYLCGLY